MTDAAESLFIVWIGMALGNFIVASFTGELEKAFDRTIFQGGALLVSWFVLFG